MRNGGWVAPGRRLLALDQRGSIATLTGMLAPVLIGAMGFGIDVSYWTVVRLEAQRTADLAAIAGALDYAATNNAKSAAIAAASMGEINGATGASSRNWNADTKTLTDNEISVQIVGGVQRATDTAVKVTNQRSARLWFSRMFVSRSAVVISAAAWVEIGAGSGPQPCVLALSGDGTGVTTGTDIALTGNADIVLNNCTLRSDASINIGGSATVGANAGIYAGGAISVSGSASVGSSPINQNAGQIPDPYANDAVLWSALGQLGSGGQSQPQSGTLNPGSYSSLDFKGAVTLNPGLYVVNGPISFESNAAVTGSGVTIVSNGSVTMNGQANISLSAPGTSATNGAVPGILYANPAVGQSLKWNGGSSETFTGVFYAPASQMTINGNAGAGNTGCLEVIAAEVDIKGSANLAANCSAMGALAFGSLSGNVALVE